MEVFLSPKIPKIFNCKSCHYSTSNKKDFEKHRMTRKHQKHVFGSNLEVLEVKKSPHHYCECSKQFVTHGGLWKHKQKCKYEQQIEMNKDVTLDLKSLTNMVLEVVKQNKDLMLQNNENNKQNIEVTNKLFEICKNGTHNNINSNNKSFNLNFFLNETCKNAMNIMDFVDSIQLQLSDLVRVGELGYVEGISNIITTNLQKLDVTQRPVHCTDKKRETIYIKDENIWEKDEQQNKLRKAVKKVASKNQRLLPKFKEVHPDCVKSSSQYSDQYNKLIIEAMGGRGDNDYEKEEKIIKKISKTVIVEKDVL